jgi:formylmethanofuran dehydrogenase subunit E
MGKLIIFLLIIGAIYFFFFKKPKIKEEKENDSEDLILCENCKTFYPKNEIKKINGKNICKDCYANS